MSDYATTKKVGYEWISLDLTIFIRSLKNGLSKEFLEKKMLRMGNRDTCFKIPTNLCCGNPSILSRILMTLYGVSKRRAYQIYHIQSNYYVILIIFSQMNKKLIQIYLSVTYTVTSDPWRLFQACNYTLLTSHIRVQLMYTIRTCAI
jgi:hypothetical protein